MYAVVKYPTELVDPSEIVVKTFRYLKDATKELYDDWYDYCRIEKEESDIPIKSSGCDGDYAYLKYENGDIVWWHIVDVENGDTPKVPNMTKLTTYTNLGFGEFPESEIAIVEEYTPSNDFQGTRVYVDGKEKANSISTRDAIEKALDEKTAAWILADESAGKYTICYSEHYTKKYEIEAESEEEAKIKFQKMIDCGDVEATCFCDSDFEIV